MKLTRSKVIKLLLSCDTIEGMANKIMEEVNKKEVKVKKFDYNSKEYQLAIYLDELICANRVKLGLKLIGKEPNFQQWTKHIDLMVRVDKIDINEIKKVIEWCQTDDFWKTNILSTQKLRKHYSRLGMNMMLKKNNNKSNIRTVKYDPIS